MAIRRPETLTGAVARHISDAIVRGDYSPGSNLPEVALARELDTSRGTVREALRMLAAGGLVEIIPHRGVFVSQLSLRATWEITSLRAILEPYAARLALEAAGTDPDLVAEVDRAYDALKVAVRSGDPLVVADADIGFHRAVFARCDHQMLLSRLEALQVLSRRLVLLGEIYASDGPAVVRQHAPIAAAVRAGKSEALETAVRSHVIEAGELLMEQMAARQPAKTKRSKADPFQPGSWPSAITPDATLPLIATTDG
jgi:DNA-binding GntR family transcriptional regulator